MLTLLVRILGISLVGISIHLIAFTVHVEGGQIAVSFTSGCLLAVGLFTLKDCK